MAAVLLVVIDLAIADRAMVFTLPQGEFDRPSAVAGIIAAAEAERPSDGGRFRVFRLPGWGASPWSSIRSPTDARRAEAIRWERDTLLPNFGLVEGIESTRAQSGAVEHADFEQFFQPYIQQLDAGTAAAIRARAGQDVYCYPKPAFDLWNTRYFLLPTDPGDWAQGNRALISFFAGTERIYPRADPVPGVPRLVDFQVRRNLAAFPRAWTVHDFVAVDPAATATIRATARRLARGPDVAPDLPGSVVEFDPRTTALIETGSAGDLAPYRSRSPADPAEAPRITLEAPGRVEMELTMRSPGLVVLGHRFDRGWRATVDGQPAPILKANHLMRAVAVAVGTHRIVYRYDPWSFRIGAGISLLALIPLGWTCVWAARGPTRSPLATRVRP